MPVSSTVAVAKLLGAIRNGVCDLREQRVDALLRPCRHRALCGDRRGDHAVRLGVAPLGQHRLGDALRGLSQLPSGVATEAPQQRRTGHRSFRAEAIEAVRREPPCDHVGLRHRGGGARQPVQEPELPQHRRRRQVRENGIRVDLLRLDLDPHLAGVQEVAAVGRCARPEDAPSRRELHDVDVGLELAADFGGEQRVGDHAVSVSARAGNPSAFARARPYHRRKPHRGDLDPRSERTVTSVQKLQSQGVHHITLVGADRQTSIDFWEGVLGMPFVFEQPNLDNAAESHLYFDPGDGRLITVFTNEERAADPSADADRPGLRAPPRLRGLAGDLRADGRAARRARDQAQRRQGPRLHGLDLLQRSARPADRARVLSLRAAGRAHARRRAARGAPAPRRSAATTTSRRSTSPTRSSCSCGDRGRRCRTTGRRATRTPGMAGSRHRAAMARARPSRWRASRAPRSGPDAGDDRVRDQEQEQRPVARRRDGEADGEREEHRRPRRSSRRSRRGRRRSPDRRRPPDAQGHPGHAERADRHGADVEHLGQRLASAVGEEGRGVPGGRRPGAATGASAA